MRGRCLTLTKWRCAAFVALPIRNVPAQSSSVALCEDASRASSGAHSFGPPEHSRTARLHLGWRRAKRGETHVPRSRPASRR
jgi:hypothetical protein